MGALGIIGIILASYVAHIFICREMNIWMMNNKHKETDPNTDYFMAVGAWFIPVLGLLYILIFTIRLAFIIWMGSSSVKWFTDSTDGLIKNNWFTGFKKWFVGDD